MRMIGKNILLLLSTTIASEGLLSEEISTQQQADLALDAIDERRRMIEDSIEKYLANNSAAGGVELLTLDQGSGSEAVLRDPFNSSGNQLNPGGLQNRFGNSTFLPNSEKQKIPRLKLKGVVNIDKKADGDLLALLQIDKKETFMVRVGDEISYDPTNPSAAIKIMSITRLSVKVQVGSLGNILIVR